MRRLSHRQKLLAGVFGIIASAWTIDRLLWEAKPSPANAAPTPPVVSPVVALPPDPPDLDRVMESLGNGDPPRSALAVDGIERDLFMPTPRMTTFAALAAKTLSASAEPSDKPEDSQASFDARHELHGVLTGRVPLALIDGALYRRGAEIDGYRLVELERDYVVFVRDGSRVTLRMAPAAGR